MVERLPDIVITELNGKGSASASGPSVLRWRLDIRVTGIIRVESDQ